MALMSYAITGGCCQPQSSQVSCCLGQVSKRSDTNPAYTFFWGERVNGSIDAQGPWSLRTVTYSITMEDGTALPGDPTDLAIYQVGGTDQVTVNKAGLCSKFVLTEGLADASYRVTAEATFRDCDGIEQVLQACIIVLVEDC